MRILVTGSREWTDSFQIINAFLDVELHPWDEVTVIHGDCPTGLDPLAAQIAKDEFGWKVEPYPADWAKHGKAAGPIRNQEMVDAGADVCLAFFQPGAANRGTQDCVSRAEAAGIPVKRYPEGGTREPAGDSPDSPAPGEARLPGGSDDYLPRQVPGGDPVIAWPVVLKGAEYEPIWEGGVELNPDGSWTAWESRPPEKSKA